MFRSALLVRLVPEARPSEIDSLARERLLVAQTKALLLEWASKLVQQLMPQPSRLPYLR